MMSKKFKGVIIILVVLFAVSYVAKLNAKIDALEKMQTVENETTEIVIQPTETTATTTEQVLEVEEEELLIEESYENTTEEIVGDKGVDLLSVHTLIGDPEDYFEGGMEVMDNIGNVYDHVYYISDFDPYDGGERSHLVFMLNGKYEKLVIENIGLPESCKNDDSNRYFLTFYGDGNYIGGTKEFTAGVYPQEYIEIDVTGVKELKVNLIQDGWFGYSRLIVESMKLY